MPNQEPTAAPMSLTFVGREDALVPLRRAVEAAHAGHAQTVVVHGPEGIGKTALIGRLTAELTDVAVVRVDAVTTSSLTPYGIAERLLLALTGDPAARLEGDSPAAAGARLVGAIDSHAERRPLLIHLDDLQLCDRESMEAILFAQRRLLAEPVVSVFSGRAEGTAWSPLDTSPWPPRTRFIPLGGLTAAEIDDLVGPLGLSEPWTTSATLAAATNGNPLHLQALLAASPPARARHLLGDGGSPTSPHRLLAERVTSYGLAAWGIASTLAVADAPLPLDALRRASDVPDADREVASLERDGIIERPAGSPDDVWFSSNAYAAAVADALDPADRTRCHERLALVTTGFEQLRHRVSAAEECDDALADDLVAAALVESAAGRLQTGARCRLWASQLTRRPEARAQLACEAIRSFVVATEESQALAIAPVLSQLPDTAATMEARAALAFAQGRLAAARTQLLAAVDRADSEGAVDAGIRVRLGLAYVDCLLARGREAAEASRRVVEQDDELTQPTALAFLALARALQDGASAGLDQLAHLPDDTAEVAPHDLTALVVRGQLRGLTGDLDGAIADLSAGVRRRGAVIGRVLGLGAYVHLTWAQYFAGSWEAAHRTLDVVRETSSDGARQFDRPILHSLSAILAAGAGDGARAREDVDRAEQLAAAADFDGPMLHVSLARAAIAQALGRPAEVVEHLAALRPPRIEPDRHRLNAVLWLPSLVDARVAVGDPEAAAADLAELAERARAGAGGSDGGGLAVPLAWARGRVLEGRGEPDAALAALGLGLSAISPQGEPAWYRAHVRAARGRLLIATGGVTDGAADLGRAEQSFRAMGAAAFADRCAREIASATSPGPAVPDWLGELTPRERETADLVARGWTNKEIAAHQFVSPKTVEYHLRNTYIKLGITSRRELRDMLQARSASGT